MNTFKKLCDKLFFFPKPQLPTLQMRTVFRWLDFHEVLLSVYKFTTTNPTFMFNYSALIKKERKKKERETSRVQEGDQERGEQMGKVLWNKSDQIVLFACTNKSQ